MRSRPFTRIFVKRVMRNILDTASRFTHHTQGIIRQISGNRKTVEFLKSRNRVTDSRTRRKCLCCFRGRVTVQ